MSTGSPVPEISSGHEVINTSHGQITPSFGLSFVQVESVMKNGVKSTTQIRCVHEPLCTPSLPTNVRRINFTAPAGALGGKLLPEQSSTTDTVTERLVWQLSTAQPSSPQLCG